MAHKQLDRKVLAWLMILTLAVQPLFTSYAYAQTKAEPDASQGKDPRVEQAANGTVVVNIRTPDNNGLSHNQYRDLQVGSGGIIFNNSANISNTQLAGYITGNSYLGAPASRILNEVTGSIPTNLNGYLEVAGNRADLIIANPNGIVGNNFGFINTNRAVLTTGLPQLQNGNLNGFIVTGGEITIEGSGMDARGSSKTQILANAVKINAALHANDLEIITGSNEINYNTDAVTALEQADRGGISLDVAALGSMYAGRITLVGTRKGLGVNSEGVISAQDISITSEGKIQHKSLINADNTVVIKTASSLDNQGRIYGDNIAIQADELNNHSLGDAPVIAAHNTLNIGAGTINNKENAHLISEGDLNIGGTLDTNNKATGTNSIINNNSATIEANGNLVITSVEINNTNEHFSMESVKVD